MTALQLVRELGLPQEALAEIQSAADPAAYVADLWRYALDLSLGPVVVYAERATDNN